MSAAAAGMVTSRMKSLSARIFAHLPDALNERALARMYSQRASAEIATLTSRQTPADHLNWIENGSHFLKSLTPTADLLVADPYRDLLQTGRPRWPDDLPDAERL